MNNLEMLSVIYPISDYNLEAGWGTLLHHLLMKSYIITSFSFWINICVYEAFSFKWIKNIRGYYDRGKLLSI